jgi:hypothetical protein
VEGSDDEDGGAHNADQPEVPEDTWAQETYPSFERLKGIQGLLLTSRQVREEVLDFLYGGNVFCIDSNAEADCLEQHLGMAKIERIKHIMLVLLEKGIRGLAMDANVWDTILPNLKTLRVVAEQPFLEDGDEDQNAPGLGYVGCNATEARKNWAASFVQMLDYVGSKLPGSTTLLTDIGGTQRRLTLSLLEGSSHPQQMIRTKLGDGLLRRKGMYTYDPDYDCDLDVIHVHVCIDCYTTYLASRQAGLQHWLDYHCP